MSAPTTENAVDAITAKVLEQATAAQKASRELATLTTAKKNTVLLAAADAIDAAAPAVLKANEADVKRAEDAGTEASLVDRLRLTADRISGITGGLRQVAALPDPIGVVVQGKTLPNGLQLRQVQTPMGVVGFVYEARPNVTVDGFGISFKSGNAVLLRGSSSAADLQRGPGEGAARGPRRTRIEPRRRGTPAQ